MRFIALEKLINLYDGYIRHCRVEFHNLLLLQRQGQCFVIESHCPHREHPLDVATVENGIVVCALHGYQFGLAGGELLSASEEPCRALRVWPVVYRETDVGIMWESTPA